jgi:hypothetical protein
VNIMTKDAMWLMAEVEFGGASADELIQWACDRLVEGGDSASLVLLAGLTPAENDKASDLFCEAVRELGYRVPERRELMLHRARCLGVEIGPCGDGDPVLINGVPVDGFFDGDNECEACGLPRIYHVRYDAYFCAVCNRWLEHSCDDPACEYCRSRPTRPLTEDKKPL